LLKRFQDLTSIQVLSMTVAEEQDSLWLRGILGIVIWIGIGHRR
jgi:hypothetical protein